MIWLVLLKLNVHFLLKCRHPYHQLLIHIMDSTWCNNMHNTVENSPNIYGKHFLICHKYLLIYCNHTRIWKRSVYLQTSFQRGKICTGLWPHTSLQFLCNCKVSLTVSGQTGLALIIVTNKCLYNLIIEDLTFCTQHLAMLIRIIILSCHVTQATLELNRKSALEPVSLFNDSIIIFSKIAADNMMDSITSTLVAVMLRPTFSVMSKFSVSPLLHGGHMVFLSHAASALLVSPIYNHTFVHTMQVPSIQ